MKYIFPRGDRTNSLQALEECMYELPHLTLNLTKPQLLLLLHTVLTWSDTGPEVGASTRTPDSALIAAVFSNVGTCFTGNVFCVCVLHQHSLPLIDHYSLLSLVSSIIINHYHQNHYDHCHQHNYLWW